MSRKKRLGALLLLGAGLFPIAELLIAATGRADRQDVERRRVLGRLPRPSKEPAAASFLGTGAGRSMPRTTASLLGSIMSTGRRTRSIPNCGPRCVGRAHANHCAYAEEYALADGRRAGLDEKAIEALRRGDYSHNLPAEKSASIRPQDDREFSLGHRRRVRRAGETLRRKDGRRDGASMAYANFQDRVLLCLGSPLEADGPLPPLDVVFRGCAGRRPRRGQRGKTRSDSEAAADQTPPARTWSRMTPSGIGSHLTNCRRLERQRQDHAVRVPGGRKSSACCRQFHDSQSGCLEPGLPGSSPELAPRGKPICEPLRSRTATRSTAFSVRACSG